MTKFISKIIIVLVCMSSFSCKNINDADLNKKSNSASQRIDKSKKATSSLFDEI